MIVLAIICIILLLLSAIFLLRIKFHICAAEDIELKLDILGIKFYLYPQSEKKANVNKFKKGYPKEKVKKETAKKKVVKKTSSEEKDFSINEKIDTIISLLKHFLSKFFKHIRLDVSKIIITVGGSDAANCAITYGIVSQSVVYLLEFLDNNININKKRNGEINVSCNFTKENTTYDILITASITVWQILDIAISLAYNYFKGKDIFNIKKSLIGGYDKNGGKQN